MCRTWIVCVCDYIGDWCGLLLCVVLLCVVQHSFVCVLVNHSLCLYMMQFVHTLVLWIGFKITFIIGILYTFIV